MRYGLLALSIAMLTSGGFAVQSALAITTEATANAAAAQPRAHPALGDEYGAVPFASGNSEPLRLAMR